MNDQETSLEHFTRVQSLSARLASRSIAIYEYQVHLLAFGSFTLQSGDRHRRWQFIWDGKDGTITVSTAAVSDSGNVPEWREELTAQPVDDPYAFVENYNYDTA